jgi:hypothetical protein
MGKEDMKASFWRRKIADVRGASHTVTGRESAWKQLYRGGRTVGKSRSADA